MALFKHAVIVGFKMEKEDAEKFKKKAGNSQSEILRLLVKKYMEGKVSLTNFIPQEENNVNG